MVAVLVSIIVCRGSNIQIIIILYNYNTILYYILKVLFQQLENNYFFTLLLNIDNLKLIIILTDC